MTVLRLFMLNALAICLQSNVREGNGNATSAKSQNMEWLSPKEWLQRKKPSATICWSQRWPGKRRLNKFWMSRSNTIAWTLSSRRIVFPKNYLSISSERNYCQRISTMGYCQLAQLKARRQSRKQKILNKSIRNHQMTKTSRPPKKKKVLKSLRTKQMKWSLQHHPKQLHKRMLRIWFPQFLTSKRCLRDTSSPIKISLVKNL